MAYKRKPQLTRAGMEALAKHMEAERPGMVATVTPNGRHIIAIGPLPAWAEKMKAAVAARETAN